MKVKISGKASGAHIWKNYNVKGGNRTWCNKRKVDEAYGDVISACDSGEPVCSVCLARWGLQHAAKLQKTMDRHSTALRNITSDFDGALDDEWEEVPLEDNQ